MTNQPTCGAATRKGTPCQLPPMTGWTRCQLHPGIPHHRVRAHTKIREEIMKWGLDPTHPNIDPGTTLLALVAQSKQRVDFYATLLEQAFTAAEALREAHRAGQLLLDPEQPDYATVDDEGGEREWAPEPPALAAARLDLERVFATGGVGALIGTKKGVDKLGRVFDEAEAIRGLALLEAEERDRLARLCKLALDAGIAERQVRIAESQGALVAGVVRSILGDLGLTADQWALVGTVVPRRMRELSTVVEGTITVDR